jgi:hypothetical protein|tara:strand:- start:2879 stop:3088 length:210 start_codon:yes stop_codon:yes gene_type:complete
MELRDIQPGNSFTFQTKGEGRFTLSVSDEGVLHIEFINGTSLSAAAEAFLICVEELTGKPILRTRRSTK